MGGSQAPQVQWGNTDTRYAKHAVPVIQPQKSITLEGWRGEKLHAQAVVWTGTDLKGLNYSLSEFKNSKGRCTSGRCIQRRFCPLCDDRRIE